MSSIEVVDVNNETKKEEAPVNNEVVEQNETVNEEPTPEEVKPEEVIPEPKAKAKALPRVNYHDDIYGPEVHEVGPHVVSCMLYIQVIVKA